MYKNLTHPKPKGIKTNLSHSKSCNQELQTSNTTQTYKVYHFFTRDPNSQSNTTQTYHILKAVIKSCKPLAKPKPKGIKTNLSHFQSCNQELQTSNKTQICRFTTSFPGIRIHHLTHPKPTRFTTSFPRTRTHHITQPKPITSTNSFPGIRTHHITHPKPTRFTTSFPGIRTHHLCRRA